VKVFVLKELIAFACCIGMIILPCFAETPNASVSTSVTEDSISGFDIPDITIKARDASSMNEIEKEHVDIDVPRLAKEKPVMQKNFVFAFFPDSKEAPIIIDNKNRLVQSINNFYMLFGSSIVNYKYFYGKSDDSNRYYVELERNQRLISNSHNFSLDHLTGSLSTVVFDNNTDFDADYKRYQSEIPGGSKNFEKSQLKILGGMTIPLEYQDNLFVQGVISPFSQAISNKSHQLTDVGLVANYQTNKYSELPIKTRLKLGRINGLSNGFSYFTANAFYEQMLSLDEKLGLGIDAPFFWNEASQYNQMSLVVQYTREFEEASTAWIKYFPGMEFPSNDDLYMSDPYRENAGRIHPERRFFQTELGVSSRYFKNWELVMKLNGKMVKDPLLLSDINGNKLVEYHNGTDISVIALECDASYTFNDQAQLRTLISLTGASAEKPSIKVPYIPFIKGMLEFNYTLDPSLLWQSRVNIISDQYASSTGGTVPGNITFDTSLKKQISKKFEGYLSIKNILGQKRYIYQNIPDENFIVAVGFTLNL